MALVHAIFTCASKRKPMEYRSSVMAYEGVGLDADRYALGKGSYSHAKHEKIRHATLIALERVMETPFQPNQTRRNIVVKGLDLAAMVGKTLIIGDCHLLVTEICEPCDLPTILSGVMGFKQAFANGGGGVRVQILSSGLLAIGREVLTL